MRGLWINRLFLLLTVLAGCALAQTASAPPPDIQAILRKARANQDLTEQEEEKLQRWQEAREKELEAAENDEKTPAPPRAKPGASARPGQRPPVPAQAKTAGAPAKAAGFDGPCPPARPVAAPAAAPTAAEFSAMVRSLVDTYGRRLGPSRAPLDAGLSTPEGKTAGGDIGAVLLGEGAAAAAVYSSAVAVTRDPADILAINNLGAALEAVPDNAAAVRVLRYAVAMRPDVSLPVLNLGWAYYHAGQAASARQQFDAALRLNPGMTGAETGLGMLAGCRGDMAAAERYLKSALGKRFSASAARALGAARAARSDAPKAGGSADMPPNAPPPSADTQAVEVPELPVSSDPARMQGVRPAIQQVREELDQRTRELISRHQELMKRVAELNRRVGGDPDKGLVLRRVFDKELFLYAEIARLTLEPPMRSVGPVLQTSGDFISRAGDRAASRVKGDLERFPKLIDDRMAQMQKAGECKQADPEAYAACQAPFLQRLAEINAEIERMNYGGCEEVKRLLATVYEQNFKSWKAYSDAVRAGTKDLYRFSEPVLERVYLPSLHDLMQVNRELAVTSGLQKATQMADALAGLADDEKTIKCIPPVPAPPPGSANAPQLPQSAAPQCPIKSPIQIKVGSALKVELDCDKLKIKGGEGIIGSYERNFKKKETTLWFGVGVNFAEAGGPMPLSAGGEMGFGATFRDGPGGTVVQDVFMSTKVSAGSGTSKIEVATKIGAESGLDFSFPGK